MSLYDVWDKGISEVIRSEESNFWLGGWTHVRAIGAEYEKDKEMWKKDGAVQSFERWAEEAVGFACEKAYTHPTTGKKLAGPDAEKGPVTIDEMAYENWKELWLRQILIAGERTAIVLNDILDSSSAAKLHDGTGVKTKADEEKQKQMEEWDKERVKLQKEERAAKGGTPFRINWSVLATNLSIAAVVVPIFLLVANYGLNPLNWAALGSALLKSLDGNKGSAGRGPPKRFD